MQLPCRITGLAIACMVFILDQWSKSVILKEPGLSTHNVMEITPFFNLALVFNRGVSFGMFAGHNQPLLLTGISLVITIILLIWLWRSKALVTSIAIGCIIGGATGNIADRIHYGAVVDFLDFHVADMHWPAFNIADSFVFIGVVVLCAYSMFFEEKKLP
jgi:signal peptidase II